MKKIIALFGSLLIIAGVKAQTTPTVKKETVRPVVVKDTTKTVQKSSTATATDSHIKGAKTVTNTSMKETKAIKQTVNKAATTTTTKPFKY